METICIYHKGCLDGFGAAWVVREACKRQKKTDIEFYAAAYQEAPPNVENKDVIIVDFSYKRHLMDSLIEQANGVLILDHHKSAENDLTGIFEHEKVSGCFDMKHSGVMLAWNHFFFGETPPPVLQNIQDRDLWVFKLETTKAVCAALYSYDQDFEVWDDLINNHDLLVSEGQGLLRQKSRSVNSLIKSCAHEIEFEGHKVLAANMPHMFASDAGNIMAIDCAFSITYYYDKEGHCNCSLRSAINGVDVSEIALRYGGGGHKHAAGFRFSSGCMTKLHEVREAT